MNKPTELEVLTEAARLAEFYGRSELAEMISQFAAETTYEVVDGDELQPSDSDGDLLRAAGYGGGFGLAHGRSPNRRPPAGDAANDCCCVQAAPGDCSNGKWWE